MNPRIVFCVAVFLFSCSGERGEKIIFPERSAIDTIPFSSTPDSNIILLDVLIEEKSYQFIFDTGSETTLINSTIPSKRVSSDSIIFKDIFYQSHYAYQVMVDTLLVGKIKIIQKDSYQQRNLNLDGILGDDIIKKFVWKFDLSNRKTYVSRDIKDFDTNGVSIPFRRHGQFIVIICEINGAKIELIVDTGSSGFVSINKTAADSIFVFKRQPISWEGISTKHTGNPYASTSHTPRIDTTYYFTSNVEFGGISLENEIIELTHNPFNIIGMDFFKRFEYFILDYPNGMIHLGNEQHKSLAFLTSSLMRMNTKGITLVPKQKVQIGKINSLAKENGINYLDTVLSIDGISVINKESSFYLDKSRFNEEKNIYEYNPSQFMRLWNNFHFVSDTSVVELKRGDSSQTFTLMRQYLFREMPDSLSDHYVELSLPIPNINEVRTESGTQYFKFKTEELLPPGLRRK